MIAMRKLVLSVVGIGVAAAVGAAIASAIDAPMHTQISGSYSFDVTDRRQLAGYADYVVVGRVMEGAAFEDDGIVSTDYTVRVQSSLLGAPPSTLTVRQLGGTLNGDTWSLEEQPTLQPGEAYLLVLTDEPGVEAMTLVAGPLSAVIVGSPQELDRAENEWREAIANKRDPFRNT